MFSGLFLSGRLERREDSCTQSICYWYEVFTLTLNIKQAGGYWSADEKAWKLSFNQVLALGLERRVIEEEFDL